MYVSIREEKIIESRENNKNALQLTEPFSVAVISSKIQQYRAFWRHPSVHVVADTTRNDSDGSRQLDMLKSSASCGVRALLSTPKQSERAICWKSAKG